MRFDTRNTKPKLRALQALTAGAAVIIVILRWAGGERSTAVICFVMAAYALGAILALLWAFREQIRCRYDTCKSKNLKHQGAEGHNGRNEIADFCKTPQLSIDKLIHGSQ